MSMAAGNTYGGVRNPSVKINRSSSENNKQKDWERNLSLGTESIPSAIKFSSKVEAIFTNKLDLDNCLDLLSKQTHFNYLLLNSSNILKSMKKEDQQAFIKKALPKVDLSKPTSYESMSGLKVLLRSIAQEKNSNFYMLNFDTFKSAFDLQVSDTLQTVYKEDIKNGGANSEQPIFNLLPDEMKTYLTNKFPND